MIRVFLITSDAIAMSVLAKHSDHAAEIFGAWLEHQSPEGGHVSFDTKLVSLHEIAVQPQLEELVTRGVAGILYWVGHRSGYVVAGPTEPQLGAFAPPQPPVRCYVFNDGDELLVFAPAIEHAVVIWNDWQLTHHGERREFHTVEEMPLWLLQGPLVSLREDMELGLAGVGSVCADGFWRIYPRNINRQC